MKNVITILKGIVLLLCALFVLVMADSIIGELLALGLFAAGLLVCLAGFHNSRLDD